MNARHRGPTNTRIVPDWVARVAREAAAEAQTPVDLLDDYLEILSEAALNRQQPRPTQLAAVRRIGREAAEHGLAPGPAVDLYLSAAWRLWRAMPAVDAAQDQGEVRDAAEAVLRVVTDSVDALVDGYQSARREMIRREESARREFVDDLLRGDADVSRLVQRAEPFGLDLGRPHQVLLAATSDPPSLDLATLTVERAVVHRYGDREVLVATKGDMVVIVLPDDRSPAPGLGDPGPTAFVHARLIRHKPGHHWQVAAGRPYPGAYGIARSYEEARESLQLAQRLHRDAASLHPRDLLLYRVLGRDQTALVDLVHTLLGPLTGARGGAEPLLRTLETYFATGGVAAQTARLLHLSVRTVTYRLARVQALTGNDPADPEQRLALHMAVLGARLLDWPAHDLVHAPSNN